MSKKIFILGAADPEMQAIEGLLIAEGIAFGYAALDGIRVNPGNAYKATGIVIEPAIMPDEPSLVLVECGGPIFEGRTVSQCDHHRIGDPGYGRPPAEFWVASSLGQVTALVAQLQGWPLYGPDGGYGHRPTHDESTQGFASPAFHPDEEGGFPWGFAIRDAGGTWRFDQDGKLANPLVTAAADHCLAAAYKWGCPGVNPKYLMEWRADSRAKFQGRSFEAVMEDIHAATDALEDAPKIDLGGVQVADLRQVGTVPEVPEASARLGMPFIARLKERDGRNKVVLQSAPPEAIVAFLAGAITGLSGYYGDPARGFAGGYEANS